MADEQDLSKITINGQEYDSAEAQEYIETGRKTRELEKQYNTSFDKVWPDYNRASQENAQYKRELQEARAEVETFKSKQSKGIETPNDEADAKAAARKLGIVLNDDLTEQGYIKKNDLDKYFEEKENLRRSTEQVISIADRLSKEIDGSDGRPKFNKKAVMAYASQYGTQENGLYDLQKAYEDMNSDDVNAWKEAQVAAQKAKGLKTLGKGGEKVPSTPKIGRDNFSEVLSEALNAQVD